MNPTSNASITAALDALDAYPDGTLATPLFASAIGLVLVVIAAAFPRTWYGLLALLPLALAAFGCIAALLFFGVFLLADQVDDTLLVACWLLPTALTCAGVALWLRKPR